MKRFWNLVKRIWKGINEWIIDKKDVFSAWSSLLQIVIFPLILITIVVASYQLVDYIAKPDLILTFSTPWDLTYRITNIRNVVADRPLYWITIYDIDGPPLDNAVPFPAREISYIRGKETKGQNAFGSVYGKKGHRYFGSAGINCKNCERTRRYWLYFVHGSKTGAWYIEMEPDEDQGIVINAKKLIENPDKYLAELLQNRKRIPIE